MIKFNNGMVRFDVTLKQKELNYAILNFISSVHEVDLKNATIMWDSTSSSDLVVEKEMNFACKINLRSQRTSVTHKIPYNELIVIQEKSSEMENNIIFMLIEFLDLDDHELARELKNYQIEPDPENDQIKFVLTFSFNE